MKTTTRTRTGSVSLDTAGMDAIEAAAKADGGRFIKVGILAGKASRQEGNDKYTASDKGGISRKGVIHHFKKGKLEKIELKGQGEMNNPTLGLIHEKGSIKRKIPRRSFLLVPLLSKLPDKLAEIGADVWASILATFGVDVALAHVAVTAENIVQEAFATGGYGQWPPNSPKTIRQKGSSAPLIDSAQLRKSITSLVVKGN